MSPSERSTRADKACAIALEAERALIKAWSHWSEPLLHDDAAKAEQLAIAKLREALQMMEEA